MVIGLIQRAPLLWASPDAPTGPIESWRVNKQNKSAYVSQRYEPAPANVQTPLLRWNKIKPTEVPAAFRRMLLSICLAVLLPMNMIPICVGEAGPDKWLWVSPPVTIPWRTNRHMLHGHLLAEVRRKELSVAHHYNVLAFFIALP